MKEKRRKKKIINEEEEEKGKSCEVRVWEREIKGEKNKNCSNLLDRVWIWPKILLIKKYFAHLNHLNKLIIDEEQ